MIVPTQQFHGTRGQDAVKYHQNSSVPWCYKWHALSHFFMVFPTNFTKTARYHDATNDTRYLFFEWYFPWNSPKQLSTMMLQITHVISFFHGISHEIHQNSSVPWCYKWRALSHFFMVFPTKFTKTAQYHDATNDTRYLNFHGISHEIHQNSSVPWC